MPLAGVSSWPQPFFRSFFFLIFLAALGLHCCAGLSLVVVPRLLVAVASLVVAPGL